MGQKTPSHDQPPLTPQTPARHVTEAIVRASNGLQFGSVGVVIHDGRLVQVARTERMRVQEPATR